MGLDSIQSGSTATPLNVNPFDLIGSTEENNGDKRAPLPLGDGVHWISDASFWTKGE
jgi:hypothetical protein